MKLFIRRTLFISGPVALLCLIAACGGGSSSAAAPTGSSPPVVNDPPQPETIQGVATPSAVAVVTATNAD